MVAARPAPHAGHFAAREVKRFYRCEQASGPGARHRGRRSAGEGDLMRRQSTRAALVGALAVTLAACATGSGETTGTEDGSTDDGGGGQFDSAAELSGELEIMGFGLGDDVATSRFEVAEEAVGPEVSVNPIEGALDIQQFLTSVASGNPPDLIITGRDQIGAFASRGAIIPLGQCIEGEGIVIDDYRDAALEQVTFAGEVYAIPEFDSIRLRSAERR